MAANPPPTRRRLLARGATALAGAAAAPALLRIAAGCNVIPDGVGSDGDGRIQLAIDDHPALADVGGFELLTVEDTSQLLAIVRVAADGDEPFVVLDGLCTHAGCRVDTYDRSEERLICRCHDSEFTLDGDVWSGPALLPLAGYDYTYDGALLDIDLEPR